jgi:negative regulator of flagellin synthesis FlgM
MSNKIDGTNQGQPIGPNGVGGKRPAAGPAQNAGRAQEARAPGGETVQLTSNAQMMERMSSMLETLEMQNERLDAIMESIASGDYEIDAEKIAARLMMFERSLGSDS